MSVVIPYRRRRQSFPSAHLLGLFLACVVAFLFVPCPMLRGDDAGALRLAVYAEGDGRIQALSDLVRARLSSSSVELLDRDHVKKVVYEAELGAMSGEKAQALGAVLRCDVIATLSALQVNDCPVPIYAVTAFDTGLGLRLCDQVFPGELGLGDLAGRISASLLAATGHAGRGAPEESTLVPVSMVSVRGVGLDADGTRIAGTAMVLLERALLNAPGIVILERTALRRLLTEERITMGRGIGTNLLASSLLIDVEVSGGTAGEFALKGIITDLQGKAVAVVQAACRADDLPVAVEDLAGKIAVAAGGHPVTEPLQYACTEEALRLFHEAEQMQARGAGPQLEDAALVLAESALKRTPNAIRAQRVLSLLLDARFSRLVQESTGRVDCVEAADIFERRLHMTSGWPLRTVRGPATFGRDTMTEFYSLISKCEAMLKADAQVKADERRLAAWWADMGDLWRDYAFSRTFSDVDPYMIAWWSMLWVQSRDEWVGEVTKSRCWPLGFAGASGKSESLCGRQAYTAADLTNSSFVARTNLLQAYERWFADSGQKAHGRWTYYRRGEQLSACAAMARLSLDVYGSNGVPIAVSNVTKAFELLLSDTNAAKFLGNGIVLTSNLLSHSGVPLEEVAPSAMSFVAEMRRRGMLFIDVLAYLADNIRTNQAAYLELTREALSDDKLEFVSKRWQTRDAATSYIADQLAASPEWPQAVPQPTKAARSEVGWGQTNCLYRVTDTNRSIRDVAIGANDVFVLLGHPTEVIHVPLNAPDLTTSLGRLDMRTWARGHMSIGAEYVYVPAYGGIYGFRRDGSGMRHWGKTEGLLSSNTTAVVEHGGSLYVAGIVPFGGQASFWASGDGFLNKVGLDDGKVELLACSGRKEAHSDLDDCFPSAITRLESDQERNRVLLTVEHMEKGKEGQSLANLKEAGGMWRRWVWTYDVETGQLSKLRLGSNPEPPQYLYACERLDGPRRLPDGQWLYCAIKYAKDIRLISGDFSSQEKLVYYLHGEDMPKDSHPKGYRFYIQDTNFTENVAEMTLLDDVLYANAPYGKNSWAAYTSENGETVRRPCGLLDGLAPTYLSTVDGDLLAGTRTSVWRLSRPVDTVTGGRLAVAGTPPATPPLVMVAEPVTMATNPALITQSRIVKTNSIALKNSVTLDLVWIEPGDFTMGSDACEVEKPPRTVHISRGFWMSKTEITQRQYESVMGMNPSVFIGSNLPVENVSWPMAKAFTEKLNEQCPGQGVFRLPTEAEWEYACGSAAGVGWHIRNSGGRTHPVGEWPANENGLHDMIGNVLEWCSDWYERDHYRSARSTDPGGPERGRYRVIRGGCWADLDGDCTSKLRNRASPDLYDWTTGIRVVVGM